jgi:hypothetical protein
VNVRQYARAQQRPLGLLRKLIRAILHALGVPITPFQVSETALRLYRPVLDARTRNYLAAERYLTDLRLPPEIVVPAPREFPLEAVKSVIADVTRSLRIEGEPITAANRTDTRVIEVARKAIEGPVAKQASEPARETIAAIGEDDLAEGYGWARVLVGATSCSFCAMLASRGPVYTSRAAAVGRGGPMGAYHTPYVNKSGITVGGFCDCVAVIVPRGKPWEGERAYLALEDLWLDETEDQSGKDALNAFRRAWERKVRAGETGRYLAPSLTRAA